MLRAMFWMVLGEGTPVYRHSTLQSAKTEAERLARLIPGTEFTILASVATVVKSDIHWEEHDEDGLGDEIPF